MTSALRLRLEAGELRADRQFAVAYLKAALEELNDPNNRAAGLLPLKGNPTFKMPFGCIEVCGNATVGRAGE
jgi:hypothetical protein